MSQVPGLDHVTSYFYSSLRYFTLRIKLNIDDAPIGPHFHTQIHAHLATNLDK